MAIATNSTGWGNLISGKLVQATYELYDTNIPGHIFIFLLFLLFQALLYIKTRSIILMWITGIIFGAVFLMSAFVSAISRQLIFGLLILELAGILYFMIFK